MNIYPLDEYGFDMFGCDFSIVFSKFKIDQVLRIVLVFLSESKILFTSQNIGLLTPIIQVYIFYL